MKPRRTWIVALLSLPFFIGLALDLLLNAREPSATILHFQVRIDLGTLALLIGGILSGSMLAVWGIRELRTRRRQLAQEHVHREAVQLRRRFLAQLDHELKNPLTALRAEIAYLAEEPDVENYPQAIGDMSTQVDRLGRLVSDLRKLAELEDMEIILQPVNMGEVLEEVQEAAQDHPGYEQRQVRLLLLEDPWPLSPILGDRGLLWLACYNLLDNALKFTPPGATIEMRLFETAPWLIIEVVDNGPGIPGEDLPHIFEELYRGENARGSPGSGLGLALVQAVIKRHKGTIDVRSRPGQGAAFTVRLPLSPPTN